MRMPKGVASARIRWPPGTRTRRHSERTRRASGTCFSVDMMVTASKLAAGRGISEHHLDPALGGCLHGRWTFVQADDLRDRKTALKLGEHQAVARSEVQQPERGVGDEDTGEQPGRLVGADPREIPVR